MQEWLNLRLDVCLRGTEKKCGCREGRAKGIHIVPRIKYRSDDITKTFLYFSVVDTMYRWSIIKNIHSPNLLRIGSWGPEIWPYEYLINPYEFPRGTQASMSPRRTECLRGAENYTFSIKKLISQQPFIRCFFFFFFPLQSLIER